MTEEIWKPVFGYEEWYEVSNFGNVRSLDRMVKHYSGFNRFFIGKLLVPQENHQGYLRVRLCKNGKLITPSIASLVAMAFIGERPEGQVINHKDGIKNNNIPSNLEYITYGENIKHAIKLGLRKNSYCNKLNESDVISIRKEYVPGLVKQQDLADKYGVDNSTISEIINRKKWSHI